MRFVVLAILLLFGNAVPSSAQTYWLPTIERTPTETVYRFDTRMPDYMVPWLLTRTSKGGGETVKLTSEGTEHTLVRQTFGWDENGSGPRQGVISFVSNSGLGNRDVGWKNDPALAQDTEVIAALDALATTYNGSFRQAEVLALRQDGPANSGVRVVVPVPEGDQIKARMRTIAETTIPGQFYPDEVQIPTDLDAMRREMLAWGNLGRRDPEFRRANRYANDFSQDTVSGPNGRERLHKDRPQPPYFDDLVLHPELNEACQFMAEYYAKTDANARQPTGRKHDAPGVTYDGADMSTLSTRLDHFAPGVGSSGEGLGGGSAPDAYPESWMRTETHYRPWFRIDFKTVSMGLGAAKWNGRWYFCKIGGIDLPTTTTETTNVDAPASGQGAIAPGSAVSAFIDVGSPTPNAGNSTAMNDVVIRAGNFPAYGLVAEPEAASIRENAGDSVDLVPTGTPDVVRIVLRDGSGRVFRHAGFRLRADVDDASDLLVADSSFRVVPALNGDPKLRSLESVNFPNHFLRHVHFVLHLQENDRQPLFLEDASFRIEPR